jgi:hypothetical protein
VLVLLLASTTVFAKGGDRFQFGKSVYVAQDEAVGDVVCIACSIHMDGSCGDLVALGGNITVGGDVDGDAVAILGSLHLDEDATLAGDAVSVGGRVWRHPNATVKGDISSRSGLPILIGLVAVPLFPLILMVALIVWLVNRSRGPSPTRPTPRV